MQARHPIPVSVTDLCELLEFNWTFEELPSKNFRILVETIPRHVAVAIKVKRAEFHFQSYVYNSVLFHCINRIKI